MTNFPFGLVFFGVVAFMIGLVVFSIISRRRQRERLAQYAASRGWGYEPSGHNLAGHLGDDYPFNAGDSRKYSDVFTYTSGDATGMSLEFTYSVTTRTGDTQSTSTYPFHVVTLNLPVALPRLMLRREGRTDAVGKFFGRQDIQFESAEFNKAWLVQGDNLAAAHDIVNPRMMEWLMDPRTEHAAFSISGSRAITYVKGRQRTENIDALIARVHGFVAQIPGFVWDKAR